MNKETRTLLQNTTDEFYYIIEAILNKKLFIIFSLIFSILLGSLYYYLNKQEIIVFTPKVIEGSVTVNHVDKSYIVDFTPLLLLDYIMKDQDNPGYNNNIVLRNGNFGFAKNGETTIIINSERLMLDFMNILSNRDVIKQAILEMSVTLNNIDGSEDDKDLKASQIAQEFRVDGQNISFSTSLELNEYQPILQKAFELAEQEVKKRILDEVDSLINLLTYTTDYKVNRIESEILLLTQNYETQNQIRNKLQLREILLAKQKRIKILEDHYKIAENIELNVELSELKEKNLLKNRRVEILQYHYKVAESLGINDQLENIAIPYNNQNNNSPFTDSFSLLNLELSAYEINSNKKNDFIGENFPHYLRGTKAIKRELDIVKQTPKEKGPDESESMEEDNYNLELTSYGANNNKDAYLSETFPHFIRGTKAIKREIDIIKNSLKSNLLQNTDLKEFTSQPPKIANLKILLKRLKTKLSYQIAEIDRVIKKTPLRNDTFKAVSYNTNLISFVKEKAIVNEITFSTSPFKKIVFTFFLFGLIFSLILAIFINGFNNFMKRKGY